MPNSSFYVIGKRGHGVVFLRMDPLRVSRVSHQTILAYEAQNAGVDGYARIAAAPGFCSPKVTAIRKQASARSSRKVSTRLSSRAARSRMSILHSSLMSMTAIGTSTE